MLRLALLLLAAVPAWAQQVAVPSGQSVELIETFWDLTDPDTPTLRLRFLAPEVGSTRGFEDVGPDFAFLCRAMALPLLTPDRAGALIVISFADRPVEFGAFDPDATQFFEGFRAGGDGCIVEVL
jgi:hypothetical protein